MVPGVLFVVDGPQLVALDAASGARLFSYIDPGGGVFYGSATVAGADVWIGNSDGSLREFALPT
jgi:hypothetical protein